jgi:hypothetical protein
MVVVQALLAMVFRSAGRLLNTAFGWATIMLFGRVPQDRQIYLSLVSFGSVIWLIAVFSIAFPTIGTFVLSFVPLPEWVDRKWVRLTMLAVAIILPAIVGVLATRLVDEDQRPKGGGAKIKMILRGYPYTVGLALTLILMTVFAPVLKLRDVVRRWTTQHVPVMVEPADYPSVVDDLERALHEGGVETRRGRPSWMLRFPTRLLGWFAGSAVGDLVAENLTRLYATNGNGEILLHPSDMVISARERDAARMRAIIAERLPFTRAYLTWDAEANEIEDSLRRTWDGVRSGAGREALAQIRAIDARIQKLSLPYEEWEVLFRQRLQVERAALRRLAGVDDAPTTGHAGRPSMLQRALEAVAETVAEIQRSWSTERKGQGAGLVSYLAAVAALSATMVATDRRNGRPNARHADLPAPDAHTEARFPRAA